MPFQSSVSVDLDVPNAYARVINAIQEAGGQVKMQTPPQNVQFELVRKKWKKGSSWGVPLRFYGTVGVQPISNKEARVTTNVKADFGSAVPLFIFVGISGFICALLLGAWAGVFGMIWLALTLGFLVSIYINLNTNVPEALCQEIVAALPVTTTTYTPPPEAGLDIPAQTGKLNNTPPEAGLDIPAQIKKLAELRDMGALTTAEFEAKKAELLKRL